MSRSFRHQFIPLALTFVTFFVLCFFLYGFILFLNLLPIQEKIQLSLRKRDILIGLTIYLKTSIDFAIFIGNLMKSNPGWKKRIAIEIGTAVGNALGTLVVLAVWNFFREVPLLMACMIILASFVLLKMAEESFEELQDNKMPIIKPFIKIIGYPLKKLNEFLFPLLSKLVPHVGITKINTMSWASLVLFSFSIPFILGLDDFAGYIPLFSIVNVFGFAVGVFLGHTILNAALFVSPAKTTQLVKHPIILLVGGVAFVGIALWGFFESYRLLLALLL